MDIITSIKEIYPITKEAKYKMSTVVNHFIIKTSGWIQGHLSAFVKEIPDENFSLTLITDIENRAIQIENETQNCYLVFKKC